MEKNIHNSTLRNFLDLDLWAALTLYLINMLFKHFCKQSRPSSGSSCKSCLIRVYSVCLWTYDISDPTQLDLKSNFFVLSFLLLIKFQLLCRCAVALRKLHIKRTQHTQFYTPTKALKKEFWMKPTIILRLAVSNRNLRHC